MIGPDEYHDQVDDNAFTNVMARWNLRRAARLPGATDDERASDGAQLARRLVDGYDPRTRLYEQFAGFWDLEPLVISEMAASAWSRPTCCSAATGVRAAQILKQPDVLMLHHMLPGATHPDRSARTWTSTSREPPSAARFHPGSTQHCSRAPGEMEEAVAMLRLTARLDLDDLHRTTAGWPPLAAMGSALAGARPGASPGSGRRATRSPVDPRLPVLWTGLEIPVTYHGTRVRFRFEPESVSVDADRMLRIRFPGDRAVRLACGRVRVQPGLAGWQEVPS